MQRNHAKTSFLVSRWSFSSCSFSLTGQQEWARVTAPAPAHLLKGVIKLVLQVLLLFLAPATGWAGAAAPAPAHLLKGVMELGLQVQLLFLAPATGWALSGRSHCSSTCSPAQGCDGAVPPVAASLPCSCHRMGTVGQEPLLQHLLTCSRV
jgi:hypothetical protein